MHASPAESLPLPPSISPTTPERLLALYACPPGSEETLWRLFVLLERAAAPASLAECMEWLESLSAWLRAAGPVPVRRGQLAPVESAGSGRLRLLVELLREVPAWCSAVRELVAVVLEYTSALRLLAEAGLSAGWGPLGDAALKLGQHLVPGTPDEEDLATLLWRLFPADEVAWLDALADEHVAALYALLRGPDDAPTFEPLALAAADAAVMLAARISAQGTERDVLARLPPGPRARSLFLALPRACEGLRAALNAIGEGPAVEAARAVCAQTVSDCRAAVQRVLRRTTGRAVGTGPVYQLEQLGAELDRLEALLRLLTPDWPRLAPGAATRLLASLVRARAEERNVTGLLRGSMRHALRRILASTGVLGRHDGADGIVGSHPMVRAAARGGVLTAATAALTLSLAFAALPLLPGSTAAATHPTLTVMLLQLLGFTLAVRQPSRPVAALVLTQRVRADDGGLRHLVGQVTRLFRS